MSAEKHDRIVAKSQAIIHFIGRLLDMYGMQQSKIDTNGVKKLLELKEQVSRDTWQLFYDMQNYNPYTKDVRKTLKQSFKDLEIQIGKHDIFKNSS